MEYNIQYQYYLYTKNSVVYPYSTNTDLDQLIGNVRIQIRIQDFF